VAVWHGIDNDGSGREVYLTDDERVIFYDNNKLEYSIIEDPEQELGGWPGALRALGIKPVVDL
jgi:hypothetical protein